MAKGKSAQSQWWVLLNVMDKNPVWLSLPSTFEYFTGWKLLPVFTYSLKYYIYLVITVTAQM